MLYSTSSGNEYIKILKCSNGVKEIAEHQSKGKKEKHEKNAQRNVEQRERKISKTASKNLTPPGRKYSEIRIYLKQSIKEKSR